jgi:small-conductance mechanosensitive channel
MAAAEITPLHDVDVWLRSNGLEIVMLVLGAVLLARFVSWLRVRISRRMDTTGEDGEVVLSERSKHRRALTDIVAWVSVVVIWTLAFALVLNRLGIPFPSLVAPLAAGGVALGLGAQRIVSDLLGGGFIIAERQYGLGDLIRVSATPQTDGAIGTVEELTLRITRLRTPSGERVIIPNGQIVQVTNLSSDWARAIIDVPLPLDSDIVRATEILRRVCTEAYESDELRPLLLDTPVIMGVESFADSKAQIRVVARTLPGKQFDVARKLRVHIAAAFQRAGVASNVDVNTAPPASET